MASSKGILPLSELRKTNEHDLLGGVCAGTAYWLGVAPWCVRAALLLLGAIASELHFHSAWPALLDFTFQTAALPLYFLAYLLLPEWDELPADFDERCWIAPADASTAPPRETSKRENLTPSKRKDLLP